MCTTDAEATVSVLSRAHKFSPRNQQMALLQTEPSGEAQKMSCSLSRSGLTAFHPTVPVTTHSFIIWSIHYPERTERGLR